MEAEKNIVLIDRLRARTEQQLKVAISTFQNLTSAQLLRPSEQVGWSIAQCLAHLNSYGHYYLPEIKKGLESAGDHLGDIEFKSTGLGRYFTKLMEPGNAMKKMKAFKRHVPEKGLEPHAVVAEFIQQQETLLQCLKMAVDKDLNAIRIPISIARFIKMKLGDVFQFILAHNERHIQQALRNL